MREQRASQRRGGVRTGYKFVDDIFPVLFLEGQVAENSVVSARILFHPFSRRKAPANPALM